MFYNQPGRKTNPHDGILRMKIEHQRSYSTNEVWTRMNTSSLLKSNVKKTIRSKGNVLKFPWMSQKDELL